MKRSQRFFNQARACAWKASTAFMLGIAAACWVPAAMVDNSNGASPIWLICLIATASTCLVASVATACNAMRLYRLGIEELAHEARCAIRPRL